MISFIANFKLFKILSAVVCYRFVLKIIRDIDITADGLQSVFNFKFINLLKYGLKSLVYGCYF